MNTHARVAKEAVISDRDDRRGDGGTVPGAAAVLAWHGCHFRWTQAIGFCRQILIALRLYAADHDGNSFERHTRNANGQGYEVLDVAVR
jgi:hypothetical protein